MRHRTTELELGPRVMRALVREAHHPRSAIRERVLDALLAPFTKNTTTEESTST